MKDLLENLMQDLHGTIFPLLKDTSLELQSQVKSQIKTVLKNHGILTQSDLALQSELLAKARLKLDLMEKRLADLETKFSQKA